GLTVGLYREDNKLIPIISRPPPEERRDVDNINDVQIWSDVAQHAIPLRQVVSGFDARWDDGIIKRRDRVRTIEVRADAFMGELASDLLARVKPEIDAIELPPGYKLEWGGEYEDSARAQSYIAAGIPVPVIMMVLILVLLFNNLRQPLVILLTVPLAIIGVSVGLLLANEPFGFMAMLGFLSLSGMLIKNAIVLIDQINQELSEGQTPLNAVIESGVSRMRPVAMAAATTVLGMIPLFKDPFYIGMAVTIIGGLSFATLLTLLIVPVLYATVYRIPSRSDKNPSAAAGVHHD
ncbi:MAG: efflux RND transporter permease subunit, partial [Candidatus Competibacteraceae bacterium]|nr:efflux RND transporter permease subunit [Candidatus Competibacteraceae bacterium]